MKRYSVCASCGELRTVLKIREALSTPKHVDVVEHARRLRLMFAKLLTVAIATAFVVACATPTILIPPKGDYPCGGPHGVCCEGGGFCSEGEDCGAEHTGCSVGMCCANGEVLYVSQDGGRAHHPQSFPALKSR